MTTTLSAALVNAQIKITPVAKDATNQHHRYAYASAETMIDAARIALNISGLACTRLSYKIEPGQICFLTSTFQLDHSSGEFRLFENLPWPIIEGAGRPFDKALAGALTTQLAYFLRDLLLIPKEDENEIDRRNDATIKKPMIKIPEVKAATLGLTGAGALRRSLKQSNLLLSTLAQFLQDQGTLLPAEISDWPVSLTDIIRSWITREAQKEESAAKA